MICAALLAPRCLGGWQRIEMALVLPDALERKLRGVYDALDDRSYKVRKL